MMVNTYTPATGDATFTGDGVLANQIAWAQFEVGSAPGLYVDML